MNNFQIFIPFKIYGSAGRARTYNPSVTLSPKLSFECGLSHQLFSKLSDTRGDFIGLVSSISSLCTFLLTSINHSAGFAQDYHSKFL